MTLEDRVEIYMASVAEVADFPKSGIKFKDISALVRDHLPDVARDMLALVDLDKIDFFAGIESRGFVFAAAMAALAGKGVVLVRKKGKLPPPTVSITYDCEYSTETLEAKEGSGKVCLVDDCAALGNTFKAACELLEKAGYSVAEQVATFKIGYLPGDKSRIKSLWEY
jgi:adenine phosphoribosyltransferase